MTRALIGLLFLAGCPGPLQTDSESWEIEEAFDRVVLDAGVGNVSVLGEAREGAEVDAMRSWRRRAPTVEVWVEGNALWVEALCEGQTSHCQVDLDLVLPEGVEVEMSLGVGDVTLSDLGGEVTGEIGVGNVEATALAGPEVTLEVGTGSIDLAHQGPFDRIDTTTGVGGIDLEVPAGAYDLDLATGVGSVDTEGVTDEGSADSVIRARTGTGSITVTGVQ